MTDDNTKTKAQLIAELQALRGQLAQSETLEIAPDEATSGNGVATRLSRVLLEALPDLIFRCDAQGTILEFHAPAATTDLFVGPERFLGKTIRDVLPAAVAKLSEYHIGAALAGQGLQTFEYSLPFRDRLEHFELRLAASGADQVIAVARNITERRLVEAALRTSEEKYRLLFDAAVDAMVLVDAATLRILDANHAATKMYGYEPAQLQQMKATQLSARPALSQERIKTVLNRPLGLTDMSRNLHRRQDGSEFYVDIAASTLMVEGRRVIFAVFRDITPVVEATRELAESRELFRQLAEHIREVFWLFDWRDQTVLYLSPAYETVWGRKAADLYADYSRWGDSIHPEDKAKAEASFAQIVETGGGEAREYRILRLDGEERWVSDRGFAIYDEAGEVVRIAGLAEDITLRKAQERERDALIVELEQKNEELERFTYTVSHDLRSPLITIRGFLGHLKQDLETGNTERFLADITRIEKATALMGQLLDELLELSRIGRVIHPTEQFPLLDLVHDVLSQMARRLEAGRVEVTVDPALPTVTGDKLRLREVFENLVDNALRHLGSSTEPRLEIGVRQGGPHREQAVITVGDNGLGIDPAYHERIFRIFERLDPASDGTGIGLAIVKRIIEVHNGQIWVESDGVGHGSTFCFTIPGIDAAKIRKGNQTDGR